jgi:hypothetical protein
MVNVCGLWSMPKAYIYFLLEFLCYVFYDINTCICLSMMYVLLGSWQRLLKTICGIKCLIMDAMGINYPKYWL